MAVVEAAGMPLLTKAYETVLNTFPDWMLYEYMFRHPELLEATLIAEYQEHKAIVEAIANGDAEQAAGHTLKHILNLGKELVAFLNIPESVLQPKEQELGPLFVEIQNLKNSPTQTHS
jgi:DNA-binding GntR family transcriptional regulator